MFIFPSATIFYGLLNRPSPAPGLFFMEGHSFGNEDLPRLDQKAVESLERNGVCIWVKELTSFMGEHKEYWKIPRTKAWLEERFERKKRIGPFELWERTSCSAQ